MTLNRIGLILLTGSVIGSSVVMTRLGVLEIPPLTLVALRLFVATLAFALVLVSLQRQLPRDSRTWLDIAIVGITNTGVPLVAFTLALQYMSSAVLTLFIALAPLFTGLMAHVWLTHEKLNLVKLVGFAVALGGVTLLILTGTTGLTRSVASLDVRGPVLALAGILVGSASVIYTRLRLREADVLVVTAGQMATGLVVVAPFAFTLSTLSLSAVTWRGWFAVGYTGLIGSFLGFLLFFTMIKRFGATVAALSTYVMPVVSAGLGVLMLGEVITLTLIAGAALILGGVFLVGR